MSVYLALGVLGILVIAGASIYLNIKRAGTVAAKDKQLELEQAARDKAEADLRAKAELERKELDEKLKEAVAKDDLDAVLAELHRLRGTD